jgi:hypothetical protein
VLGIEIWMENRQQVGMLLTQGEERSVFLYRDIETSVEHRSGRLISSQKDRQRIVMPGHGYGRGCRRYRR